MIPGYYSRPKTAQEREQDLRYASSARFVDDPIAVESKLRRNIFEVPPRSFRAQAEISGNTLRVKFLKQFQSADETRGDELYWANAHLDGIEKSNVPIISAFPREFLIYILKSYINLPGLPDDADFPLAFHPNLRRIEMCVLPTVMTEILKLDPTACESRARLVLSCSTGFEPMTSFEEAAGQTLSGWTKADGLTGLTDTERDA
jgi:hypothetical protein